MDFKVKIRYAVEPHSVCTDECQFSPYNEFSDSGQNIWWSSVNGIKIFIKQKGYRTEIREENIEYEPKIGGRFLTQKHEIVKAFNDYLATVYS
ncbi:MAG: hypothetical protein HOP30_08945 [Cyclobacteriaceae bacterium]|nr:hypothetical protein [Cyclobacteriaceae bacterium]